MAAVWVDKAEHDLTGVELGATLFFSKVNKGFPCSKTSKTISMTDTVNGVPIGISMSNMQVITRTYDEKTTTVLKIALPKSDYTISAMKALTALQADLAAGKENAHAFKGVELNKVYMNDVGDRYEIEAKFSTNPAVNIIEVKSAPDKLCLDDEFGSLTDEGIFKKRSITWLSNRAGSSTEFMAKIGMRVVPYSMGGNSGISASITQFFVFAPPTVRVPTFEPFQIQAEDAFAMCVPGVTTKHAGKSIMFPMDENHNIPDSIVLQRVVKGLEKNADTYMKCAPTEYTTVMYTNVKGARAYGIYATDQPEGVRLGEIEKVSLVICSANSKSEDNPTAVFSDEQEALLEAHKKLDNNVNGAMAEARTTLFSSADMETLQTAVFEEFDDETNLIGKRSASVQVDERTRENAEGQPVKYRSARIRFSVAPWCEPVFITAGGERITDKGYMIPRNTPMEIVLGVGKVSGYAISEKGFSNVGAKSQRIKMSGMKITLTHLVLKESEGYGGGPDQDEMQTSSSATMSSGISLSVVEGSDDEEEVAEPFAKRIKKEEDDGFIGGGSGL